MRQSSVLRMVTPARRAARDSSAAHAKSSSASSRRIGTARRACPTSADSRLAPRALPHLGAYDICQYNRLPAWMRSAQIVAGRESTPLSNVNPDAGVVEDQAVLKTAETKVPSSVATPDAIHLATARRRFSAQRLDAWMTYDARPADGAAPRRRVPRGQSVTRSQHQLRDGPSSVSTAAATSSAGVRVVRTTRTSPIVMLMTPHHGARPGSSSPTPAGRASISTVPTTSSTGSMTAGMSQR